MEKSEKSKMVRSSFSLSEELLKQLTNMSNKENRSISSMIQVFIREGIEKRTETKKKNKMSLVRS